LRVEPEKEGEGYELLVDYRVTIGDSSKYIECDLWRQAEQLMSIECSSLKFPLAFSLDVREVLAPQDITASSNLRDFKVLCAGTSFYVSATRLHEDLGGTMFSEWNAKVRDGEKNAVVQVLEPTELAVLLKCCCGYSSPIIHRRNLHTIMGLAARFQISKLLRLVEAFLVESTFVHRIRKLEYAAEGHLAILAHAVLRSFKSRIERLDSLHEYMAMNGESLGDMHPDVLKMLDISPTTIVI